MSYKIGEVSKMLNMSVETIRYYEAKNIIKPSRNEDSKYRVYETWDLFYLLESIMYKGFNFSLNEISHIMYNDSLENIINEFKQKQNIIKDKIEYYNRLYEKMENYISKLDTLDMNQGNFWVQRIPESVYFICTESDGDQYTDFNLADGLFTEWLNYKPFLERGLHISIEDFHKESNNNHIKWSLFIEKKFVDKYKIPVNDKVAFLPEHLCLCTIVDAGDKGQLSNKLFESVITYAQENKYIISGDVIGKLLLRIHDKEKFRRYFEIMIPVERK